VLGFQPWSAGYPDRALEEGSGALFPRPMIAFGVELKKLRDRAGLRRNYRASCFFQQLSFRNSRLPGFWLGGD